MFSELLKQLRAKNGVTQGQLAKAVGVSSGNVGDWETGKSKPGYIALAALARFFEVPADYLLELDTTANASKSKTANPLYCDDVPLGENEMDLISMYRYLNSRDKEDVFDFLNLKYQKATGEKVSIYSTYSDTNEQQKSDPLSGEKSAHEIA